MGILNAQLVKSLFLSPAIYEFGDYGFGDYGFGDYGFGNQTPTQV
jgi:hypothetical protein